MQTGGVFSSTKRETPHERSRVRAVLTAILRCNLWLHDAGASLKDYLVPIALGDPGLCKTDSAERAATIRMGSPIPIVALQSGPSRSTATSDTSTPSTTSTSSEEGAMVHSYHHAVSSARMLAACPRTTLKSMAGLTDLNGSSRSSAISPSGTMWRESGWRRSLESRSSAALAGLGVSR